MNTFIYPNGQTIEITPEALLVNKYTWENYQNRVYESDSIEYVFQKLEDVVRFHGRARFVDIGAQSGLYSLYAKYFDNVYVDSYEPFPNSFKCLRDNIELNNLQGRVIPHQLAISNKTGKSVLRCPEDHTGLNTLGSNPLRFDSWRNVEIQTDTLDNLYSNKRVDLIKCDTEGWEYFVLQGGLKIIKRDHPILFLEVNETNMNQCGVSLREFVNLINTLGYLVDKKLDDENIAFIHSS